MRLNDYAKLIGCWNGLAKRGHTEHTFADDPVPMRRAVAFAGSINDSKIIQEMLPAVVDRYVEAHDLTTAQQADEQTDSALRTEVKHVDEHGWQGFVRFSVGPSATHLLWFGEAELRPVKPSE